MLRRLFTIPEEKESKAFESKALLEEKESKGFESKAFEGLVFKCEKCPRGWKCHWWCGQKKKKCEHSQVYLDKETNTKICEECNLEISLDSSKDTFDYFSNE